MGMETSEILFTRQRHEAERAGLHYDIRLVHGDLAYSWATRLDMPKPGEAIILHQQPIHDSGYALSKKVVIPSGQYGGGVTHLDFVRKAQLKKSDDGSYFTITTKEGEKYLLKHIPIYGEKQWLFKNLTPYVEGENSTVTHEGSIYKVDDLLARAKDLKTKKFPVADLKWSLKGAKLDPKRVAGTNLQFPLLITKTNDGKLVPIDGVHRLKKAIKEGQTEVKGKLLEKLSMLIELYEHPETKQRKWVAEGKPVPEGFVTTKITFYRKKGWTKKGELLEKVAKEQSTTKSSKLRPHTERAIKKLEQKGGLLVDHSMGSGKTLLYLKAIERHLKKNPNDKALVIAPASLTTNVDKEIKKHGINIPAGRLLTLSYEKAAIDADKLRKEKFGIVVADEAHKLRNTDTKRHKELSDIIARAPKRLLGTGTTAYNHPSDIAPLVNLAAGKKVLVEGKSEFEKRYVEKTQEQPPLLKRILGHPVKEIQHIKRRGELSKILRQHIDHYDLKDDPSAKDKFPEKRETIKEVQMSPEQIGVYKYMEGKLPWHLRMKVRMNMPLDKRDTATLQAFSTGVRQVSNSLNTFMPNYDKPTPKIEAAVNSILEGHKKDKHFRALVYSNYLGSGLSDYSKQLTKHKISHTVYHGGMSKIQKDQAVEAYNKGKTKVLLLSSSGAEGLNTKGTKKVQILEPHFNKSKIDQVVARAVRYESHSHLPKAERNVEVEHYLSTLPNKKWSLSPKQHSIDQYLHQNAKTKAGIGDEMTSLVKEAHFERVDHSYERAKYKETHDWESVPDPVGSLKRDGAAFFMQVDDEGKPHFYSRRPSVKGGFPDRTPSLPHLAALRFPDYKGNAFHVELIHTGPTFHDMIADSHPVASGILNSKAARAIETQQQVGPIRAVLLDVMEPKMNTYGEKLEYMRKLRESVGNPNFFLGSNAKIGRAEIQKLLKDTKEQSHEGIVVTSLTTPEPKNIRVKVKHIDTYNLKVVRIIQEVDIFGIPKDSMGALELEDATGRIVCKVGTGFTRAQRIEIWQNQNDWLGRLIQVKAMPPTGHKLRSPVYNGDADGDLDTI